MSPYELKLDISNTSDDYTVTELLRQFTLSYQPIPPGIGKPYKLNGSSPLEAALQAQKSGSDGFGGGFSSIAGYLPVVVGDLATVSVYRLDSLPVGTNMGTVNPCLPPIRKVQPCFRGRWSLHDFSAQLDKRSMYLRIWPAPS